MRRQASDRFRETRTGFGAPSKIDRVSSA